jgi:hypothetical protein
MLQTATVQQQQQQPEPNQVVAAAAAGQHASSTSCRSLQQRDNLTSSQAEGLATWARQAPESDVQYVQAIVGGGFISRAQATPQLTIDQVVGPQQASSASGVDSGHRKAGGKMLQLPPPIELMHGSTAESSSRSGTGRALLDDDSSDGGGTGTAGDGAASDAGNDSAGAGDDAGLNSATPEVRASDSSLGLTEWATRRGVSEQEVEAVKAIVGKQVLAPSSRLNPEDVKLTDLGRG